MKRTLKIFLLSGFTIVLVGYFSLWWYFETSINRVLSKGQQVWIINEFKTQKKLPQSFYITMEKHIPDFFESGVWKTKMNRTFFAKSNSVCPCNEIYLPFIPGNENRKFQKKWSPFNQDDAIIKMFIEDEFSQIDCFTFYMNNCEFGMETQGIEQAAKIYFNKLPNMLNEEEIIGLYVISKSPTRYNPKLNYKNYRNVVNTIMRK